MIIIPSTFIPSLATREMLILLGNYKIMGHEEKRLQCPGRFRIQTL